MILRELRPASEEEKMLAPAVGTFRQPRIAEALDDLEAGANYFYLTGNVNLAAEWRPGLKTKRRLMM